LFGFDIVPLLKAAFDAWSAVANIEFIQIEDGGEDIGVGSQADIRIVGGSIPNASGAQAFTPGPGNTSSQHAAAGDIVVDKDDIDPSMPQNILMTTFSRIALHEIGHSIGLRHEDTAVAVMNPDFAGSLNGLQPYDIGGARAIYGAQDGGQAIHYMRSTQQDIDILQGISNLIVVGNGLSNTIGGTSFAETLTGHGGNDTIFGRAGNDILNGNDGADKLFGGPGWDTINGGGHNDLILASSGNDTVDGGTGSDNLVGELGDDTIRGGVGNDTINGGAGNDRLFGDSGNDNLDGGPGSDFMWGGDNEDFMQGAGGFDQMWGGDGNDRMFGAELNDRLHGEGGNDTVRGGTGNDYVHGGDDNDWVFGDQGNDQLFGSNGNDLLFGQWGNDFMAGGPGNDTLTGWVGDDTCVGGSGADRFVWNSGDGTDTVTDYTFSGGDLLDVGGAPGSYSFAQVGGDVHIRDGGNNLAFIIQNYTLSDGLALV
jgi:Ca2+-binding RTX toxin-like protein